MSILKWYGRIVMWTAFAAVVLALMTAVTWIVVLVIASIPWWATVGLLVLASAWVALKIADPDALKSDFDKRMEEYDRQLFHKKAVAAGKAEAERGPEARSHYNFGTGEFEITPIVTKTGNVQAIREVVQMMTPNQTCHIAWDGENYSFETKAAALTFLDALEANP